MNRNPTEIRTLQAQLNTALHAHLAEDGIYGPKTAAACDQFRRQFGGETTLHTGDGRSFTVKPPLASPVKPWWTSRAILGLIASGVALLASQWGWQVDDEHLTQLLVEAVQFGGLVLAFWGTVFRSAPIDPTLVARVGDRDVRLPVPAERAADADPRGAFRDS